MLPRDIHRAWAGNSGKLLLAAVLISALPVWSAPSQELRELRQRMEALQKQLNQTESSKSEAVDALKASERAISQTNRRLFQLLAEQRKLRSTLAQLETQRGELRARIDSQQKLLAAQIYRQYLSGEPESLRLLLNRRDPNEIARQLHYLAYLSKARGGHIETLRADLVRLDELAAQTTQQDEALASLQAEQARQKKTLEDQREQREAVLAKAYTQIVRQRKELGSLKRDEERLSRLIEKLTQELARKAPRTAPGPRVRNERVPEPDSGAAIQAGNFRQLKGKLRLPISGELTNRFGSPRSGSGLSWRGLFIATQAGNPVRAIASGRIVFADWLRGFGNLMILDHGDGYMSLYGNNEALYKEIGDSVGRGEVIASVGNSGGSPESGLYFELRHQGKPFDPLAWVSLK